MEETACESDLGSSPGVVDKDDDTSKSRLEEWMEEKGRGEAKRWEERRSQGRREESCGGDRREEEVQSAASGRSEEQAEAEDRSVGGHTKA